MKKKLSLPTIHLTDEQKKNMMEEITYFFETEFDESIGIIKQTQMLDFFLEQLAPEIYNKALEDAMMWYRKQQDNLESEYYMLYKDIK